MANFVDSCISRLPALAHLFCARFLALAIFAQSLNILCRPRYTLAHRAQFHVRPVFRFRQFLNFDHLLVGQLLGLRGRNALFGRVGRADSL